MQLENRFTIEAPIEKAWEALNTPETIAPCFPGATLTEYEGNSFAGTVKVKLGPISLTYKGKGTYVFRDDAAHKVVIEATGRDSRGNGTAEATVTGSMLADGPDKTAVVMVTDMKITGRPAQFGRGVISDVADKIIGQFAACVADKLAPQLDTPSAAPVAEPAAAGSPSGNGAASPALAATAPSTSALSGGVAVSPSGAAAVAAPAPATTAAPTADPAVAATAQARPFAPMKSEIDAIDLLGTAGTPVLRRLLPVVGGGALLVLIVLLVRRLRS